MLMACASTPTGTPSGVSGSPLPTQDRASVPSTDQPAASAHRGPDPVPTTTTTTPPPAASHALRLVAFGSLSGGICACGWETPAWHPTDLDVAATFEEHVEAQTVPTSTTVDEQQELATRGPTTTTPEERSPHNAPPGRTGVDWRPLVATYFRTEDVDRVLEIIACESSGNPSAWNEQATSHGHATGLLQHLEDYWPDRVVKANAAGYTNGGDIWSAEDQMAVSAWLAYRTPQGFGHWVCNP